MSQLPFAQDRPGSVTAGRVEGYEEQLYSDGDLKLDRGYTLMG